MDNAISFDGKTPGISSLPIKDLVAWANGASIEHLKLPILSLPPIQRTALWRPAQILGLWDSLLRGMPIGMFYLIPARKDSRALPNGHDADQAALDQGINLLDGQQRLRALLLAAQCQRVAGKCLWIDFESEIKRDGLYLPLRLTTRSQPFGYDESGSKLSIDQRRRAREAFDERMRGQAGYNPKWHDHQLFDESPTRPTPAAGWPIRPLTSSALDLGWLRRTWNADEDGFKAALRDRLKISKEGSRHAEVIDRLASGFRRFDELRVALTLIDPAALVADDDDESDWLLRWFERIGAGGTPLTGPERCYSIFKHYQPEVHDTVTGIENVLGKVMSPVDIVDTALRIAAAETDRFWPIDHTTFAAEIKTTSAFMTKLRQLIPRRDQTARGELGVAFEKALDTVRYDKRCNPGGLPPILLAELPSAALQVLVYWAYLRPGHDANALGRAEMTRFALFWHLCTDNHEKAERRAFRFLRERTNPSPAFPGRELYEHLTGDDATAQKLVYPDVMRSYLISCRQHKSNALWLGDRQMFEETLDVSPDVRRLFRTWWYSGGKALLWLQRRYLTAQFAHYDPSSDRDEEKPYDLDHIQPRDSWGSHWTGLQVKVMPQANRAVFRNGQTILGGSIGNYRWIGSSQNRSDGAKSVREKLVPLALGAVNPDVENSWDEGVFNWNTYSDWLATDGGMDNGWPVERMIAFRNVVEERTVWLYERWWCEAGFKFWLPRNDPTAP